MCATFGKRWCEIAIGIWNEDSNGQAQTKWLTSEEKSSKISAWSGALIGAWSHLLLDSFMHADIKPLSPFSDANILLGTINLALLHSLCLASGVLGMSAIFYNRLKKISKH